MVSEAMKEQENCSPPGRVLVFTPWYPSPAEPWEGTYTHGQVTALRALGVDARVVKLTWGRPWIKVREVDPDDGSPLAPERRFVTAAQLASIVRRSRLCADSCDLILAQEVWVATALRRLPHPMVAVLHGPDPMTSSGARKDPVRKAIIRRALGRVDALVAVGMPVPLDLPPHLRDKTTVIENGVRPEVFAARDVCARTRMAAPDFPRFITVGNLTTNKNQELLLRCFSDIRHRWPRATWTIIGDGPQRSRLESLRNSLGLAGSVHFAGRLSPTDVAARFAESDLFVLPSRRDAFGCVYLEAMSVGVPTIVSRRAGMAYLVEDDRYVHDPDDATEIIAKAERILSDVEAYENAVDLGRKLAQRYTWDAHAHRLRDVLEKVVRQRRGDASCDLSGSPDAKP